MEEQIRQILEDCSFNDYTGVDEEYSFENVDKDSAAEKITTHIIEFFDWVKDHCHTNNEWKDAPMKWIVYIGIGKQDLWLDSKKLYVYWLTNIKNKQHDNTRQ